MCESMAAIILRHIETDLNDALKELERSLPSDLAETQVTILGDSVKAFPCLHRLRKIARNVGGAADDLMGVGR